MAIFDEQVLEPFVAKGLGNSGIASRQIQATNLPDLSAAVRQSIATQQNISEQQKAVAHAGVISSQIENMNQLIARDKNNKPVNIRDSVSGGSGGVGSGAFVVGKVKASYATPEAYTVAIPKSGGGYSIKTFRVADLAGSDFTQDKDALKALGVNLGGKYPELSLSVMGGDYSGEDLTNSLLTYGKSSGGVDISSILKKINPGGSSVRASGGRGSSKLSFNPSVEDQNWSKEKQKDIFEEEKLSLRNAAATIEDPIKRSEAQRRLGLRF